MSDLTLSRRDLIARAAAAALAGPLGLEAAQHVHQAAVEEKSAAKGVYKPKAFSAQEYKTLQRLAELIMPADDVSKSALEAGAPEFIDLLASGSQELLAIYTGGLLWLDREMERRHKTAFVDSTPDQQTAILDQIAYKRNDSPALGPGIEFFDWVRRMVVDAYYTSKIGVDDIGFKGNKGMQEFKIPPEALAWGLRGGGNRG